MVPEAWPFAIKPNLLVLNLQNFAIEGSITMARREFKIRPIRINGKFIARVIIDDHVDNHQEMTDSLILRLVESLDGLDVLPDDTKEPFEYFVVQVEILNKDYRFVWLLEDAQFYVGVITAFRVKKRKKP